MEHRFEVDDLMYIVYKFLDDAIDNIHPLMETENVYYIPVAREEPNSYNFRLDISSHSSMLLRVVPWYARGENSNVGWRVRFKYNKENQHLIKDSLRHNSKASRLLLDKFHIAIVGSFYTETIAGKEFDVADILAVRIDDIKKLIKSA